MSIDEKTVIGVDLGTQSVKVIIYHPKMREVLAVQSQPLELISKGDGSMEQQASWWVDAFKKCVNAFDQDLKKTLVAIGVSGQQHGFVPVSESGTILAPVKLWCDTSTTVECQEIMEALGSADKCIEIAGNSIAVGYTASKIRWLKKNKPEAYASMTSIMLPHDYLNFYLTGNHTMECGDASGTGLLNVKTRTWSKSVISAVDGERDLSRCLPNLIEADDIAGVIKQDVAQELDLPRNIVVSAGGGDNMMAAIGTGNVQSGQLTASLGTSGTLFAYSDKPVIDKHGELAAFCSSTGGWLPLLCTMNCTVATEQMRDLLEIDLEKMEKLASVIPPGADGVITVPYFNGERTPNLPNAKASVFGLDGRNTTNAHLIRSTMEAAIFNLKAGLEAFERCGMSFNAVTLTGGGAKSALWRQICADILNLPVRVLTNEENAAFGAAIQAYWAHKKHTGLPKSLETICEDHLFEDKNKGCSPNPESVNRYKEIYKDYQAFVALISQHYN